MFPIRSCLVALALAAPLPTLAADLPSLPSLALDPQAPPPSWKGLYIGSAVSFSSFKGAKPGVGGEAFAGYDHEFADGLILGLRGTTGFSAINLPGSPYRGVIFVGTDVKLGYDFGQLKPYVVTGVALARPTFSSDPLNAVNGANAFFASGAATQALGSVGAGFDYSLTNNVTIGLEARVGNAGVLGR